MWVAARHLWHGKSQCKCEKGWNNVALRVTTLRIIKDKNAATVISICVKYHNKTRNGDLGFTSST